MAKAIHMMLRVTDEARAVDFYRKAFALEVADRFDLPDFTLVYLRNPAADFEIEFTINKGRSEPYVLGNGYGHLAFAVDDLEGVHRRFLGEGLAPKDIKQLKLGEQVLGRFFFIADPDGYQIEVLQRAGRFR